MNEHLNDYTLIRFVIRFERKFPIRRSLSLHIFCKQPKQPDFHFKISGYLAAIKLTDKSGYPLSGYPDNGYPDNGYPDLQTLAGTEL